MRLNTIEFLLHEGWDAAVRNGLVTLAAMSNVAVALLILGGLVLFGINVEHMAALQAEAAVIVVELAEGADAAAVEETLWSDRVKDIEPVSAEENLRRTMEGMGLGLEQSSAASAGLMIELLGANPCPASLHIRPMDPQDIPELARQAEGVDGVAMVRYARQVTDKLLTLARGIRISGIVVGIVMAGATLLVISTTIRLTIYARREEIRIMQLVGATNWFIRVPFIIEGVLDGLAGGAIAAAIVLPTYGYVEQYVGQNLQFIDLIYSAQALVLFAVALVICGIVFGAAGSLMGLHRYLRQV